MAELSDIAEAIDVCKKIEITKYVYYILVRFIRPTERFKYFNISKLSKFLNYLLVYQITQLEIQQLFQ